MNSELMQITAPMSFPSPVDEVSRFEQEERARLIKIIPKQESENRGFLSTIDTRDISLLTVVSCVEKALQESPFLKESSSWKWFASSPNEIIPRASSLLNKYYGDLGNDAFEASKTSKIEQGECIQSFLRSHLDKEVSARIYMVFTKAILKKVLPFSSEESKKMVKIWLKMLETIFSSDLELRVTVLKPATELSSTELRFLHTSLRQIWYEV